jgi:hypothetical protein
MLMPETPSPPRPKPGLARFLFDRSISNAAAAEAIGCTPQRLSRLIRPFDDAERRRPTEAELGRIVAWTQGEVTAADFYPPHLNGAAAAMADQAAQP